MVSKVVAFTGHIYEEQEGDLPMRTQFDEMCRFQGRLRKQNSIIRHDTHRVSMDMSKTLWTVRGGNRLIERLNVQ